MRALTNVEFNELSQLQNTLIIDTRNGIDFMDQFITNSIYLSIDLFESFFENLFFENKKILFIMDKNNFKQHADIIQKLGITDILGYFCPDIHFWDNNRKNINLIISIEADELAWDLPNDTNILLIDCRTKEKYEKEHIIDSINMPIEDFLDFAILSNLEENKNIYVYSESGISSITACSILKYHGFHNIRHIYEGFNAIKKLEHLFLFNTKK